MVRSQRYFASSWVSFNYQHVRAINTISTFTFGLSVDVTPQGHFYIAKSSKLYFSLEHSNIQLQQGYLISFPELQDNYFFLDPMIKLQLIVGLLMRLIIYLNSEAMKERESLLDLSQRNYSEESEPRSKKQLPRLASLHEGYKNEEEEYIHATPSTQNAAIDDSVILRETIKKKCISCIDTEKKLYEIEHELRNERKKNLRYLKIISNKIKKEKELQTAYAEIAQELKKRMDAASARELNIQQLVECYERQAEELRALHAEVALQQASLAQASQKQRSAQQRYEELLKARQQKRESEAAADRLSQQHVLNLFYEKQLVELNQKIKELQSQLKLQEEGLKTEKPCHLKHPQTNQLQGGAVKPSRSIPQLVSHERASNRSKHSEEREVENARYSQQSREGEEAEACKPFNMSKISSIEAKNDHSDLNDLLELHQEQSFNTVAEWAQSRFHSIYHSRAFQKHSNSLSLLKSKISSQKSQSLAYCPQSEYFSIDSDLFQRELSKISNPRESQHFMQLQLIQQQISLEQSLQIQEIINSCASKLSKEEEEEEEKEEEEEEEEKGFEIRLIEVMREERNAALRFSESVAKLLEQMAMALSTAGKGCKLTLQFPRIRHFTRAEAEEGRHSRAEEFILSSSVVEEAAVRFQQQLQMILKLTRKCYDRLLNDQQLELGELRSRLDAEDEEKRQLGKIVEKLQEHTTRLEYKISESEEVPASSNNSIRETYLKSIIKKKSSLCLSRFKDEFAQCQILPSNTKDLRAAENENFYKMVDAVQYLPKLLNEIVKKRNIEGNLAIDVGKDLEPQFDDLIKRTLNLLQIQISYPETHSIMKKIRRSSFSSKQITDVEGKGKSATYNLLEAENTRLRNNIREKTEKMMALRESNTLLLNEKEKIERQMKEMQCRMQQEIQSLKCSLAQSKIAAEQCRADNQETLGKRRIGNEDDSQLGEFAEYEQKVEFNNLYEDKDEQLKWLREKNEIYERELKKYRTEIRKRRKKVVYINN